MDSNPINNFNYKLFHQLEVIRVPPLTDSFRHDDRLDATASAINYLNKKRLTEKKERKVIKESKDKLRIAEMYNSKKKTKTARSKIEKSRKAFNNYSDCLLQNAQDSLSRGEKGWLLLKYLNQKEEGIRELESAASAGYDKARYRVAKIYLREKIKETEAIEYLELSAKNYPKSAYKLAMMLLDEEPKDETKLSEALSFLNKLAGQKSEGFSRESTIGSILDELAFRYPETNYKVGYLFYKRKILGQNMSKARNHFLNYISSQGNVELTEYKKAAYKLARIYHYAKGLDQQYLDLALDWYEKAKNLEGKKEKIVSEIKAIRDKLSKDKSKVAA